MLRAQQFKSFDRVCEWVGSRDRHHELALPREVDQVAYVRFASVYQNFSEARMLSRYAALAGMLPAMTVKPCCCAAGKAAIVTMRAPSLSARDTATASSVPTQSRLAAMPCGARSRTRCQPSPSQHDLRLFTIPVHR